MDGTLPLTQRRSVEAHLRACADCRRELEAARRTIALLADLPRRDLSAEFDVALRARLTEARDVAKAPWWSRDSAAWYLRAPWPSPVHRLAPAGALAAAALALTVWQLDPQQPRNVASTTPPPAIVTALVQEHQLLGAGADLNSTVVSHNLGGVIFEEGEEE